MKPIIVGTDFSEGSQIALELAVDVANRMQTDIMLVWVKREKKLFNDSQLDTMEHLAQDKMQELCEKLQPGMKHGKIEWKIVSGKVSSALATLANKLSALMIIVGTNGASGFEKYWMGSTAVRVVQDAPCPVLSIRAGYDFHKNLERIVVPIRVNANSRQKVPPAASMAKIFGSEVNILGLLELKEEVGALRTYVAQSTDYLEREGVPYNFQIRNFDNYSDAVLSYADEVKADLVVINTEQDKIISQLFLGTNAQQIVNKSQIPVLCIHPEDYINVSARV
ncbi:MAG: universal stress protein [Bacteroidales bacterium]|nr:universal stress protein [Bacteroidales bacterium]